MKHCRKFLPAPPDAPATSAHLDTACGRRSSACLPATVGGLCLHLLWTCLCVTCACLPCTAARRMRLLGYRLLPGPPLLGLLFSLPAGGLAIPYTLPLPHTSGAIGWDCQRLASAIPCCLPAACWSSAACLLGLLPPFCLGTRLRTAPHACLEDTGGARLRLFHAADMPRLPPALGCLPAHGYRRLPAPAPHLGWVSLHCLQTLCLPFPYYHTLKYRTPEDCYCKPPATAIFLQDLSHYRTETTPIPLLPTTASHSLYTCLPAFTTTWTPTCIACHLPGRFLLGSTATSRPHHHRPATCRLPHLHL